MVDEEMRFCESMKKAAIFDMDGLLFDTERLFQKAWHQKACEMGITLPPSFVFVISGTSGSRQAEIVSDYYPGGDTKAIIREVYENEQRWAAENLPVMKGAYEILEGMREEGLILAVASSSSIPMIEGNLEKAGMRKYFHHIVSGSQVSRGKPAPDIFLLAAERSGVDPSDCYVFEDSINGILAGAAAGCASIMIPDLIPADEKAKAAAAGIYPDLLTAWRAIQNGEV